MKIRIYVDTSVVGGCVDEEFQEHSLRLMECFVTGRYILVLSNLTVQELAEAPDEVRLHLSKVPEGHTKPANSTLTCGNLPRPTSLRA